MSDPAARLDAADLPDDASALKAMLVAERGVRLDLAEELARLLDDGSLEIDTNTVERAIRPIALNRKNSLFAGSDRGGEHWATIASLVGTCRLNDVNPHTYLTNALERIVAGHPQSRIDDLIPWAYAAQ